MKTAVMQPYFMPYLGYYQLIAAVDCFVVWDDVQYINRGWVNRNRILLNGEPAYVTLALEKAAQTAQISERHVADIAVTSSKIFGQLHAAYRKAPYYAETKALLEELFAFPDNNLATFLFNSLQKTCNFLGINTRLQLSSSLNKQDSGLSGSERIIAICKSSATNTYVNAIGGRELYHPGDFSAAGMELRFIEMLPVSYSQQQDTFVPFLSIIDVMMFNSREKIAEYLQSYVLRV